MIGAGAGAGLALGLVATTLAAAATVSTPPDAPAPVSMTVGAPYDDLSSTVCDGTNAIAVSKIQSTDGFVKDLYALPGDTVELVGVAKACQWQAAPTDVLEWGFTTREFRWTKTLADGLFADLGNQTVIQQGRSGVPTTSSIMQTVGLPDDGARLTFGNIAPVTSPNNQDTVSTATTVFLHVIDPRLQLKKEVCVTVTGCDPADDASWVEKTQATPGAAVQWRLTATNLGNVPLTNVRVASDVLSGGTGTNNGCVGRTVTADLPVGGSASIVCVLDGAAAAGDGPITNTAELTSGFVDPTPGGRLLARFPDGVTSGTADAAVTVPVASTTPPVDPGTGGDGGDGSGGQGGDGGAGGTGGSGSGSGGSGGSSAGSGSGSGSGSYGTGPGSRSANPAGQDSATGSLASTGLDAAPAVLAALALAALGGLLVLLRRRPARG
ncbi:MAG: hypothetical protein AAGC66_09000 [Leifsonia sp.]